MKIKSKNLNLSEAEEKLVQEIRKEKRTEKNECGAYLGYLVPADHPDNNLTAAQLKIFTDEQPVIDSLLAKKVLEVVSHDRRATAYDFVAE